MNCTEALKEANVKLTSCRKLAESLAAQNGQLVEKYKDLVEVLAGVIEENVQLQKEKAGLTKEITKLKSIDESQRKQIRKWINEIAYLTGMKYQRVWWEFYNALGLNKYSELPKERFKEAEELLIDTINHAKQQPYMIGRELN